MLEAHCNSRRLLFDGEQLTIVGAGAQTVIPLDAITGVHMRRPGLLPGRAFRLDVRDRRKSAAVDHKLFAFKDELAPQVQAIHDAIIAGFVEHACGGSRQHHAA